MSPSNLEARELSCRLVLYDYGHEISLFPKSGYLRAIKIKDICGKPRDSNS